MAWAISPVIVAAAVPANLPPDRRPVAPHHEGDLAWAIALAPHQANRVSFIAGELSVAHGSTLAGVTPSLGQLTFSSKPGVALSLSIPEV